VLPPNDYTPHKDQPMTSLTPPGFTARSFAFLDDLTQNNEKEWFHTNKTVFQEALEQPFADVLDVLTERMADAGIALRGSARTMFRMNRDVRFSNDKSPYKTSVSGVLTPSGTKGEGDGLLYLELAADGGRAACGWYRLQPAALGPIRDRIVADGDAFNQVVASLQNAGFNLMRDDTLTAMPRGYDQYADSPYADALKLKSFCAMMDLPKIAWTSGDVVDRVMTLAKASVPLLAFGRGQDMP
jgi:uncharacterized protein (TIGR02453 family)